VESFLIQGINFHRLVHFVVTTEPVPSAPPQFRSDLVVVISHGWSQECGPAYPLIRTLEGVARRKGWRTVVPDFRPSYKFGHDRGRSERVRQIYEELLCLNPRPAGVALVGHSQGGAASSLAATPRVVDSIPVKGLLLLGSENPLSLDGMNWVPTPPVRGIVHAAGDHVISCSELRSVAQRWGFPFHQVESEVQGGKKDCWGDDIHHDFLARDLMNSVVAIYEQFLDQVAAQVCEV